MKELRVSLYTMSMKQELELSRRGLPTVLDVTYEIVEELHHCFCVPNSLEETSVWFSNVDR